MRHFGLIGHPLSHSFSKGYFESKFMDLGIDAAYINLDFPKLGDALKTMYSDALLEGVNVTIPFKTAIIRHLDSIDDEAREIQAVNTVRIERMGGKVVMRGFNTDVIGFRDSIVPLLQSHHQKALILGTGGAAKAALHVFSTLRIPCTIVSRDCETGDTDYAGVSTQMMREHAIVVNCTPMGMFPNLNVRPILPYGAITTAHLMFDMVYNPLETGFLQEGLHRGATVRNGLEMLHLQAEASWSVWNGIKP